MIIKFEDFELNETNSDGTISKDESKRRKDLLKDVEKKLSDMIDGIKKEANSIGGSFRSPGIMAEVKAIFKKKIEKL